MASRIINAVMLLLLWGIGFFGMKSSLAPIPFICKHLVPIYKLVWDTVFLYGTRNIYVFWNLLLFQKICNTVVTCATHRAVPVGLSCFHIEGNLLSRKAIWELFGNAFKIDLYIYIYIYILWFSWIWNHSHGIIENGLTREAWIWMASNIREFESRPVHCSQELTVQSSHLVVSSRTWWDQTTAKQLTAHTYPKFWVAAHEYSCQDAHETKRIGCLPSVHLKHFKWLSFW